MLIRRIELREIHLALLHPFETSFGRTTERHIILIRVEDADEAEGWGECVADEKPHYNEEWTESAWPVLERFLAPMAIGVDLASAAAIHSIFEHIRGNRMAKAAIETAVWDLDARRQGQPLWKLLGGTKTEIACGVSIGLQPSIDALLTKIEREIASGYQRIKIKIKPGHDIDLVRAVRNRFPDIQLMADANSAYTLDINIKLGRVGGHVEVRRIEALCRERGIPVWCGGMLEAGIGRAHNIALSTLAGFVLPGDVSASERYWDEDIIDPPVTVTPRGTIVPLAKPGIGFEVKRGRLDSLTVRKKIIDAAS